MGKQDTEKRWFEYIWFIKCLSWRWWKIALGADWSRSTVQSALLHSVLRACCWLLLEAEPLARRSSAPAPYRHRHALTCLFWAVKKQNILHISSHDSICSIYFHWDSLKLLELQSCLAIHKCLTTSIQLGWNQKHDCTWNKLLAEGKNRGLLGNVLTSATARHALPKLPITSVISCVKLRHENETLSDPIICAQPAGFQEQSPAPRLSWGTSQLHTGLRPKYTPHSPVSHCSSVLGF